LEGFTVLAWPRRLSKNSSQHIYYIPPRREWGGGGGSREQGDCSMVLLGNPEILNITEKFMYRKLIVITAISSRASINFFCIYS
jgi:hypothetical protein